jgi:thymidylate synthase
VDTPLGLPYNIASYALQLKLIAASVNMIPGKLIGFLADVHIYENQMEGVEEQLSRTPRKLPELVLPLEFPGIMDWEPGMFMLEGYTPYPAISFPIAV